MNGEDELWRSAFIEFAATERSKQAEHPEDTEIERFANKDLPMDREEEIRDHLTICPFCLQKVLDQKTFPLVDPPSAFLSLTEEQVEARWQAMRGRLLPGSFAKSQSQKIPLRRRSIQGRTLGLALAAMLAIAVIGIPILRQQRPFANAQVVPLVPDTVTPATTTRGVEYSSQTVSVSPSADLVVLRLAVPSLEDFPTYAIELFEETDDKPRWRESSVQRAEALGFSVSLPRSSLTQGNYRIQLWGESGSHQRLIARFYFRVENVNG